jgi:3-oxoacyl-[acyl-carrier-protein] synthase-3
MGGLSKKVLFITGDTYSSFIDPRDRSTRPIFGDAAAATLITASPWASILDSAFYTDGAKFDRFYVEGGASYALKRQKPLSKRKHFPGYTQDDNKISMDGLGVLSFFSKVVPEAVNKILTKNQLPIDEVSFFIFHQASKLALDTIQKSLKIPSGKMIIDIEEVGNLVSSSIPVAFSRLMDSQKLKQGQYVLLCGFGVGLSWGCTLVRIEEHFNGAY